MDSTVDTLRVGSNTPGSTEPLTEGGYLRVGTRVGRYVVEGVLGQGGMGVVYAAHDPELDRLVALKILSASRRGSTEAQQRLVREAQAMARVSHPNVITVHDVGLCPAGVYVAMERIEGTTAADWVEAHAPSWRDVLDVYVRIGAGLAAAHDAGLVHRDVKPTNVMVADVTDGIPGRVVLMDFGLARDEDASGFGAEASDETTAPTTVSDTPGSLTRTGTVVGTPAYMAPEMHVGGVADAVSDQFSFCVSLYEALYRSRPFAGRTAAAVMFQASQGIVAPVPTGAPRVPTAIRRLVKRGLDPVRARRWESMRGLLQALDRARRPRSRMWAVTTLAVIGTGVWALGSSEPPADCHTAARQLDQLWTQARADAVTSAIEDPADAQRARTAVGAWIERWRINYEQACQSGPTGDDHVAFDQRLHCLDRAAESFDALSQRWANGSVPPHSIVGAAVRLSPPEACLDHETAPRLDPIDAASRAELERALAEANAAGSAGQYEEAARRAATVVDQARALGAARLGAEARFSLGRFELMAGRAEPALRTLEATYWAASDVGDEATAARAASLLVYVAGEELSRLDLAERWQRHALTLLERSVGMKTETAAELWTHAAMVAEIRERYDESEALHRRAIDLHAEMFGPHDVRGAPAYHNLGALYTVVRRLDDAKAAFERALQMRTDALGSGHPDVASSLHGLGNVERMQGNLDRAGELYERTLEIRERTLGPNHPRVLAVMNGLGILQSMRGDHDESIATMTMIAGREAEIYGEDHPQTAGAIDNLGNALGAAGRPVEAAVHHRDAMERYQRALGPDHVRVARTGSNLGGTLIAAGRFSEAAEVLEHAARIRRGLETANTIQLEEDLLLLAVAQIEAGDGTAAVATASEAVELRSDSPTAARAEARFTLAESHWAAGDRTRALAAARQALEEVGDDDRRAPGLRGDIEAWLVRVAPSD